MDLRKHRKTRKGCQSLLLGKMVPGGGFEPPTRGFSIRHQIQENQGASVSKTALTNRELNENVSNADLTAKKNPAAGDAANGAVVQSTILNHDNTPNLPGYATAFIDAVTNLPRKDRLPVLELAVDHYRAGRPIPPLMGYMDEANFWADMAARDELKAYLWACWSHLNAADQAAFLAHVERRAAA